MSADEFDRVPPRPAVRRVQEAAIAAGETERIPVVPQVKNGCRSKVGGLRCGHDRAAHSEVGFGGWRQRCKGCRCTTWRSPILDPLIDATMVLGSLALAVFFVWFVLVPAFVEGLS